MIGLILLGIAFVVFGVLEVKYPETFLRLSDIFRLKEGAEYTDFAIFGVKFAGVVMVIGGIILIFMAFKLNSLV